ncbi:hypothetical protein HK098_004060 [Nowakowskiella sp. JEL0407]|nr:hypothetical protein HK098_004060 [Nowakowskiella sp. JEL0407]
MHHLDPVQIKTPVGGSMWLSNTSHPVYWTILGFSNKTIYPDRYSLILLSPSNDVVKVISNNSIPYVDSELGFPANRSDWFIQDIPEGRYRLKWVGMFSNNLPVEPPQATSQVFSILPPAAKLNAGVKERPTLMEYWNSPKKQFGSRSTRSSIIFGDDSSPFNAPQVQRTSSNSNLFDKLRSVVPAGVSSAEVSSSQQRPVNRRHTLMGGSGVASILGGSSAEENTPPKPTVSRYRSYSKSSPSPIIPPSEPQPPEPLIKSSKRHSIGIVPHASEEIRPQTKRLMPEHQLGFKPSTNIFSQDAPQEKPLPPTPQKTPPALRSSIVFGGESDSTPPPSRQMTPTSGKTNQSNLLLGDDGGVLNNTIKKKTSVRRMITPPGESGKKLSLADFVGAPPSDEVKPVLHHAKQKIDPASVGVAGKSSGKHRVY